MNKIILIIITAALLIAALPGCGHPESTPTVNAPDYAGPIAEMMLQALNAGDYQSYSLAFSEEMAQRTPEEVFLQLRDFYQKRIGEYKSMKLANVTVAGDKTTVSYNAKFSQEGDIVTVTIVFQGSGDEVTVSDFWLNSPKLWEH
jgi:hypothetical protein